jgi:hypothetical protein
VVGCCLEVGAHGGKGLGTGEAGEGPRYLVALWKIPHNTTYGRPQTMGRERPGAV